MRIEFDGKSDLIYTNVEIYIFHLTEPDEHMKWVSVWFKLYQMHYRALMDTDGSVICH